MTESARSSVLEAFCTWLREKPDEVAVYRVSTDTGSLQATGMTYREMAQAAGQYARLLRDRGLAAGDRLLLSMSDPQQLTACMLGAMSRGIVSVPLQTAEEFISPDAFKLRLRSVAADCRPALALVEQPGDWLSDLDVPLNVMDLSVARRASVAEPLGTNERLPSPYGCVFIQYTSGSCGDPKGVMITHRNLAANVHGIGATTRTGPGDRVISWLPLHHDMGLIGALLFAIYWGIPTYIMSPIAFLTSPATWLRAVQQFRGTMMVAPSFAYSLCLEKIPDALLEGLDLSSARIAFCGAEPIDPSMVQGFLRRFGAYGFGPTSFYPVYGLAESTLAAAFPRYADEPLFDTVDREALYSNGVAEPPSSPDRKTVTFVAVGRALPDHQLRVVDVASGKDCPDRRVGEVRVRGPSISPGYFSLSGSTAAPVDELSTGDLGYLADGELYIVDRLKDLVIIAGRNYAPSDIEASIGHTSGLRLGRVVALSVPGACSTEELVILAELSPRSWRRQDAIRREVVATILRNFGVGPRQVVLIPPGRLPKTSSGKVKRSECRARLQRGDYRPVGLATRAAILWRFALAAALRRRQPAPVVGLTSVAEQREKGR